MEKLTGKKIVSSIIDFRREVVEMMQPDIDFVGASEFYVEEKIDYTISALQDLKEHCALVDRKQSGETKDFCVICREDSDDQCEDCSLNYCEKHYEVVVSTGNCCRSSEL